MSSSENEGSKDVVLCFVTSEALCSGITIIAGFAILHLAYFYYLTLPLLESDVELKPQIWAMTGLAYYCSIMCILSLCRLQCTKFGSKRYGDNR